MNCPICNTKIELEYTTGNKQKDYIVKLIAHARHRHTTYDSLFPSISKITKVRTSHYEALKDQSNQIAKELLIEALYRKKPLNYHSLIKSLNDG